jgi:hypothetical protein
VIRYYLDDFYIMRLWISAAHMELEWNFEFAAKLLQNKTEPGFVSTYMFSLCFIIKIHQGMANV